jgi:mRNA interferase MazF
MSTRQIKEGEVVLCKFYFSDLKKSKNRPVLIFKNNLPYNDFIAVPISSKIIKLHSDEVLINDDNFIEGELPVPSKLMVRKTFVVSKEAIIKRYGTLNQTSYNQYHNIFCTYFGCTK